ncbi:MAG: PilZ domain-containing protein [Proteobacteria bacterium]|nr:PilZ domain-containing protein [Pseudomonadota bacterium]
MGKERRQSERQTVSHPARIELEDGNIFSARIANVSQGGALLIFSDGEALPNIFHVVDLTSDERREVRKAWTAPNRVGVQYIDDEAGHFGRAVRTRSTFGKRAPKQN